MNALDIFQQLDAALRLALVVLAVVTLAWLVSMIVAIFAKAHSSSRPRGYEIAVVITSILFAVSLIWVGRTMDAATGPEPVEAAAVQSSGGTGTCASIRVGMSMTEVRSLLGNPSIDQSSEDARGPGAHVMAFDDSRCVVHFINGAVDQIE